MARYDAPIPYAIGEKYTYGCLGDDEIFAVKKKHLDLNDENTVRNLANGVTNNKIGIEGNIIYSAF